MATNDRNQEDLRNALLKANGISPEGPSKNEQEKLRRSLAGEELRLRRSKRLVQGLWVAFALVAIAVASMVLFLAGSVPAGHQAQQTGAGWMHRSILLNDITLALMITAYVLFPASIYASIRYLLATRSLSQRQILYHLRQIERQLQSQGASEDG